VGQPILVSCPPSGAQNQVFVTIDSCWFVDVRRPLWLEDGSVVYDCCWSLPAQSFSAPLAAELTAMSQIRHSPNLEGQVPVFIYPRNSVAQLYPQALDSLSITSKSQSKLLYDWRFTANQFVLRITTRGFIQPNPCGNSPYVTCSLTRGWVTLLWRGLAFVKCTYGTCSMLLNVLPFALHTSPLSVQTLRSRSCLTYIF
jgi:hypothetical protein